MNIILILIFISFPHFWFILYFEFFYELTNAKLLYLGINFPLENANHCISETPWINVFKQKKICPNNFFDSMLQGEWWYDENFLFNEITSFVLAS